MDSRYTLSDVWHAIRTEQTFDYVFWLDITLNILTVGIVRYFSSILVAMATLLIVAFGIIGLLIVVPEVTLPTSAWRYFNIAFGSMRLCLKFMSKSYKFF